tara:strand:- start:659 stop:1174 length:516 start_codon:yes stop_codon:yes gene_type:complete
MKIAIHGPMCSGKTTISKIIQEYDNDYRVYSFGLKVKEIAIELFGMEGKERSLLINIANKMKSINSDVWINYVLKKIEDEKSEKCIIDDLRFQNEADNLENWTVIHLVTPLDVRVQRIRDTYENYEDHLKNMGDISEIGGLNLPRNTIQIDTSMDYDELKNIIYKIISGTY